MPVLLSYVGIANMTLTMNNQIKCVQLSDKKQLKRFYKQVHYSAGFKGFDIAYGAFYHERLVSALIISQLTTHNTQGLLHGLVTEQSMQNKGFARQLLSYSLASYQTNTLTSFDKSAEPPRQIVCFIEPKLHSFYQQLQFINSPISALNDELAARFKAYQTYQSDLVIMVHNLSSNKLLD